MSIYIKLNVHNEMPQQLTEPAKPPSSHMRLSGMLLCWKGKIIIAQQHAIPQQNCTPNGLIREQLCGFLQTYITSKVYKLPQCYSKKQKL